MDRARVEVSVHSAQRERGGRPWQQQQACGVSSHGVARVAVHGGPLAGTLTSRQGGGGRGEETHLAATVTATTAAIWLRYVYVVTRE